MKKLFPSLHTVKELFKVRTHTHPARDWFVLLGLTALLIGLSIGWNVWRYLSVTSTPATESETVAIPEFDTSAVDAVEKVFEERAAEARRYQDTYRFVDPSR